MITSMTLESCFENSFESLKYWICSFGNDSCTSFCSSLNCLNRRNTFCEMFIMSTWMMYCVNVADPAVSSCVPIACTSTKN